MECKIGHSIKQSVTEAVEEACHDFADRPELILFFSDGINFQAYTEELNRRYPFAVVIGASTFASFSRKGMCREGINIVSFAKGMTVIPGVIREITRENLSLIYRQRVEDAVNALPQPKDHNTVCFLLNPAGTAGEEAVLDTMDTVLAEKDIPLFGGSASSEVCAKGMVSLNGDVYTNSSIFVMLQLNDGRFHITQENIFKPMGKKFRVTKANFERRTLYELDGRNAADAVCEALQISRDQLAEALKEHPFGRILDDRLLINEVERVNDDGSITAYCRFFEDSTISLLELCRPQDVMEKTFAQLHNAMPHLKFTIAVNCYSRTQMYLQKGWMDSFTDKMAEELGGYIGLTSHGEQYGRYQLNLTLLMLSIA